LSALNKEAEVVLRVNTIKTTRKFLKDKFAEQEIKAIEVPHNPDALVLEERKNLFLLDEFKKGFFEIQDASSQHLKSKPWMVNLE
jgi:16S rRNA (cytosine967-C5)-methyltransferase